MAVRPDSRLQSWCVIEREVRAEVVRGLNDRFASLANRISPVAPSRADARDRRYATPHAALVATLTNLDQQCYGARVESQPDTVPGLSEAIERRRLERGLTLKEFAAAAGVTPQGLAPLRKGYRRNYREKLKIGVCTALGWTADSVDRLLKGLPPAPAADYGSGWQAFDDTRPVTRQELEQVRLEVKKDVQELLQDAIVIDLADVNVEANPDDEGTLGFSLEPARIHEPGEHVVLVFKGTREQFAELLRGMGRDERQDRR